jgi:two-component system CheB/CheR fusion protein
MWHGTLRHLVRVDNEEMQSTNEELEASKEELQSVNEELHTVNAELNNKVEALDRANSDLQNLFESTDVATVFLDKSLAIRSFTPSVGRIFNILPTDRGRPITDLSSRLNLDGFFDDIHNVLAGHGSMERRVDSLEGNTHYLIRMSPYRNGSGATKGVVLAFIDITNITQAEANLRVLVAELQHRTRNLLAVVQSISARTLGKDEHIATFMSRLQALARVQGLIGRGEGNAINIGHLVRLELKALGAQEGDKVSIAGPDIPLEIDTLQSMALVLHELGTNALKYGALGRPSASLAVSWKVNQDADGKPMLVLDWNEAGVPIPNVPEKRGFGLDLIERALAYTLGGQSKVSFGANGMSCHFQLPLKAGDT